MNRRITGVVLSTILIISMIFTTQVSANTSNKIINDKTPITEAPNVAAEEVEPQYVPALARAGKVAYDFWKKYNQATTPYLGVEQDLVDPDVEQEITKDLEVIFD